METSDPQIFELPNSAVTKAYWQLAGAAALILFSITNFFVALRTHANMLNLQAACTAPIIIAVFLLSTAIRGLRMAVFVQITPQSLEIRRRSGTTLVLPWQNIVLAKTGSPSMTTKKHLTLYDAAGNVLIRLSEDFQNFPTMEAEIRARLIQSPQQTELKRGQSRRKGILLMVFGVIFTALAVCNACIALNDHRNQELFQKLGHPTTATIVRQFIAPDGHTHRIEFRVDNVPNAPVVNVEVNDFLWTVMTPNQHITVIAVPNHPDIAHLALGEIADNFAPSFELLLTLSIAIGLFAVAVFVIGVLAFRGLQLPKWI